jgi:hypothetical protein
VPLRYQKAARHALIESKHGHMHQAPNACHAACIRERRRRQVMDFLIRFNAALAQDANAVHDYIDADQLRPPCIGGQQPFESHCAAFASKRLHRKAARSTSRISATDDEFVPASKQRGDGVASNETRAAQHQDAHRRR